MRQLLNREEKTLKSGRTLHLDILQVFLNSLLKGTETGNKGSILDMQKKITMKYNQ